MESDLHQQIANMRQSLFDEVFSLTFSIELICSFHFILIRQSEWSIEKSLFLKLQEILGDYYKTLEMLSDKYHPNFAEEVVTMYFTDSTERLVTIEQALDKSPLNFDVLDRYLYKLKGSSASIGAKQVWATINEMRDRLKERDIEGSKTVLEQLKKDHDNFRGRIEPYFQMLRQVGSSETSQQLKQEK
ncbi:hypothetical protein TIFTF001_019778 [Ficus carica]|uniref:Histidine-containing phosphotransfer protein n=1 Tax=Ficus carica TaxID=3494 RepID=A0AA88A791_FICCA|nr:hypothetical protein TIFTF001_019778 [Ficus carica]